MRVAVVGAGIVGLSAAWACARRGHAVAVYEAAPAVPNPAGSSFDHHRLIRYPHGSAQAGYARMIGPAFAAWEELWADLGARHYRPTGTLLLANREDEARLEDMLGLMDEMGVAHERLAGADWERRFPLIHVDPALECGAFFESGGVLLPRPILGDLRDHLLGRGVAIETGAHVTAFDEAAPALTLADGRRVAADVLILAAGPWLARLLPAMAGEARPSRQFLAWIEPPPELAAAWARMPVAPSLFATRGSSFFPPVAGTPMKIGSHAFTLRGDPEEDRRASLEETDILLRLAGHRLRDAGGFRLIEARACFYTVSPDERFVVRPRGRAWILTGFSGAGFKFGPLLGLRLAETLEGRRDAAALARWAAGQGG